MSTTFHNLAKHPKLKTVKIFDINKILNISVFFLTDFLSNKLYHQKDLRKETTVERKLQRLRRKLPKRLNKKGPFAKSQLKLENLKS